MRLALLLATGCYAATPVIHFGAGKTPEQSQHQLMTEETPPVLGADSEWKGDVRVAKLRVWADDDYRAQNVHWEQTFEVELAYANQVLGPMFGLKLEAEYRAWNRHEPGATLADALAALAQQDRGDGVLSVVGLTSSLPLVTATFDQLGLAALPGRYLMLRGYADVDERRAFERLFRDLRADEREAMYAARRRHKTAAILLHELGHNFGAQHEDDRDTIMNALYSDHSSTFNDRSKAAIRATLDRRLHRTSEREPSPPPVKHPTLIVAVNATGQTLVGGKPIDDSGLDELLQLSFADDRDTEVVVHSGKNAPHAAVIKVLDRAKAAGLQRMSIVAGE